MAAYAFCPGKFSVKLVGSWGDASRTEPHPFIHDMSIADIYEPRVARRESRHAIRGVDYAVSEWGEPGAPLFFWLHGWGDCSATFQFVVDRLASDWHVVAPDFRGFGNSRSDALSFWFPDYLADLDALLAVYSPDRPARVVGHSMGGNVAGLYAGALPERVAAFVNVEGFGLPDHVPDDAPARYRDWITRDRAAVRFQSYESFAALAARIVEDNPRIREDRARFVAACWAAEAGARVELRASPRHRLPNPVLYRRAEAEACWRRAKAPVLLVAGAESPFLDRLERAADGDVADALPFPDPQSATIAGAGHMIHFDAPSALASAIDEFLGPLVTLADTV